MNYIYDILLNFQDEYYDFYEWNNDDKITHAKKAIIIKIKDKDFYNIKNCIVTFDNEFLETIHNKTQIFKKYDVNIANYICIFCTNNEVMGVKINKNGKIIGKSSLLIDEADEVLELTDNIISKDIKYTINTKTTPCVLKTRLQQTKSKKIIKEINTLYEKKEFNKLNYLFFECFGNKETNIEKTITKLKEEIDKGENNFHKIDELLMLFNQNEQRAK